MNQDDCKALSNVFADADSGEMRGEKARFKCVCAYDGTDFAAGSRKPQAVLCRIL